MQRPMSRSMVYSAARSGSWSRYTMPSSSSYGSQSAIEPTTFLLFLVALRQRRPSPEESRIPGERPEHGHPASVQEQTLHSTRALVHIVVPPHGGRADVVLAAPVLVRLFGARAGASSYPPVLEIHLGRPLGYKLRGGQHLVRHTEVPQRGHASYSGCSRLCFSASRCCKASSEFLNALRISLPPNNTRQPP